MMSKKMVRLWIHTFQSNVSSEVDQNDIAIDLFQIHCFLWFVLYGNLWHLLVSGIGLALKFRK